MSLSHRARPQWIWYSSRVPEPTPLRFCGDPGFRVARERPAARLAKVFVDSEHVLYVNGVRAGAGLAAPGDPLALYEVAPLLDAGRNRVAIEAASATGSAGILFSLDLEALRAGRGRLGRAVAGGPRAAALAAGGRYRPVIWGRPPQHPWGYPRMPRPNEL